MNKMFELLLRSYDEPLSAEEEKLLTAELAANQALYGEKQRLDELRHNLAQYAPSFSDDFIDTTMGRIHELRTALWHSNVFRTMLIISSAAVVLLLISIYFTEGRLDIDALFGLTHFTPEEELFTSL